MLLSRSLWATIALTSPSLVSAFWRMECGISQVGRIDPIVAPNAVSGHVHKLSGGSNIGLNSTYDSMQESACTTCSIGADKSGYWTPQLYYQRGDGTFQEVQNGGTVVYYLGRGASADGSPTMPFPKGLQMLSGSPLARSYDNATMTWGNKTYPGRPVSDRTSFVCIPDYNSNLQVPQTPNMAFDQWAAVAGLPKQQGNKVCMNGMRAQIQFPSCWDGVNLYKADGSHMAYLSQIDNGACPPTHPKLFMHLFYEMYYDVYDIDTSDGGRFVFAYGDPTGYGFHGDFLNGWDLNVLGNAIQQCGTLNPSGQISTCPPLAASNTDTNTLNCPLYAPFGKPLINEVVTGNIGKKLPGCINIVNGPADATYADISCPAGIVDPTLNSFPAQTPIVYAQPTQNKPFGNNGWNYVDCFTDNLPNARALGADSLTSNNMTIETCQSYCSSKGWRYAGVEYGTQCFCSSVIPSGISPNQTCTQSCGGNSTEICGGPGMISIFNNTQSNAAIAAPGAGPVSTAAGTYVGCVSEGSNGRALTGASTTANNMTLESCRAFCSAKGFTYAGTEYSAQCYCGNSFVNGGALQSSDSSCNMLCGGNNMNMCGGPNRLSVYSNKVAVISSSSSASSTTLITVTKSASSGTATASAAASASAISCPASNGATITVGSSQFQLLCSTDFAGNDLTMKYTSSISDCAAVCSNTTGCLASSWVPGNPQGPCYMKSKAGSTSSNSGVWAIKKLAAVATSVQASTTSTTSAVKASATPKQCPADNGSTITIGTSSFTLQCATDHAGGDLAGTGSSSVEACAASCAATAGCVGASYLPGVCYMKKVNGPGQSNSAVWALVLNNALSSSSSASLSTSTSSSSALTTSSISATTSSTSSFVPATTFSTTSPPSSTLTTLTAQPTTTSTPNITCPSSNNTTYSIYNTTTLLNTTYTMQCSVDHPGNAAVFSVPTMYDCLVACSNYTNCSAVSYVAMGRACYIKTSVDPPVGGLNDAVWGAVVVAQSSVKPAPTPQNAVKNAVGSGRSSATSTASVKAKATATATSGTTKTSKKAVKGQGKVKKVKKSGRGGKVRMMS